MSFGGDPNFVFPSGNPVVLRFSTARSEMMMNFGTVQQARAYLAYKLEKENAIAPGSFEERIIRASIAIYENGKLVADKCENCDG